jgi:hypothetical protein
MAVTMRIEGLESLDQMIRDLPSIREAGVAVAAPASAWALVWEWGSARIHRPGKKTTWGENPAGDRVVLTLTAPHGYIRIHNERYVQFLQEEFQRVAWGSLDMSDWPEAIDTMLTKVAKLCAQLISDGAPIDTGNLRASIYPVGPDDQLLTEDMDVFEVAA